MPFIDFNKEFKTIHSTGYDFVIAGAGAAGILLAVELSKEDKKVLLLESGQFTETDEKQKLNEVVQTGKFLNNAVWGRKRMIGGTTTAWGGQSLPFTPIDFKKRDWVNLSGWPIEYREMKQYYDSANKFMNIDALNYNEDIFSHIKVKNPGFDSNLIEYHVSKWAKQPNFYKMYKSILEDAKDLTVLYNAQLKFINKNNGGVIDYITISNFLLQDLNINPGKLILTTGTIESVRLLMSNNIIQGKAKEWLGKCFMDHPCVEVADVETDNMYKLQQLFNTHLWKGKKYSLRMSLSELAQHKFSLLNCSASIIFKSKENSIDIYRELKLFLKDYRVRRLMKIFANSFSLFKSAAALVQRKFYYKQNTIGKLILMSEQEPLVGSTVTLGNEFDIFGTPKMVIHWDISPKTWETVIRITEIVSAEFARIDIGTIKPYTYINSQNNNWKNYLTDVNHHMGGARMSTDCDTGVVDKNLKVWGTHNLYVCSCAVFPTSSHSNPTLTMLALAERLKEELLN